MKARLAGSIAQVGHLEARGSVAALEPHGHLAGRRQALATARSLALVVVQAVLRAPHQVPIPGILVHGDARGFRGADVAQAPRGRGGLGPGTMSSEGRVASPRASSSLGPDETSAWKASVPGAGLLYWLAGGGVRVPARERPMGDPAGGGASHVPLPGPDSAGVGGRASAAKGSDPPRPWLEPGWEPGA